MPCNRNLRRFHSTLLLLFLASAAAAQQRVYWGNPEPQDRKRIEKAISAFSGNDRVHAFIVWKDGRMAAEAYYHGLKRGQPVNVKSVSKSILALAAGVAADRGLLDLDKPVHHIIPEWPGWKTDSVKRTITVRHLLTMSSGLQSTSTQYTNWTRSSDWVQYVLELPLLFEPGRTMLYSSGNSHLMGIVLRRSIDKPLFEFVQQDLLDTLGVSLYGWEKDPRGNPFGGNNMALTPGGLARIGQMVLDEGLWKGKPVVSKSWIHQMTSPLYRAALSERDAEYGYYWWRETWHGKTVHYAWGFGGQYLIVVPADRMVLVVTSILKSTRTVAHNDFIYATLQPLLAP